MTRPQPRRTTRALTSIAIISALLMGCSSEGGPPPTTTERSTTTNAPVPQLIDPPRLVDAGTEPRRTLRMQLAEGDEAFVEVVTDLGVDQVVDGRLQRLDTPPISQRIASRVRSVGPEGAVVDFEIEEVTIEANGTGLTDDEAIALQADLSRLDGVRGTTTIDDLGRVTATTFTATDDLDASAQALLDSFAPQLPSIGPALPTEPVGVGASWQSTSTLDVGTGASLSTTTTTTITVTAIDGSLVSYTSTIEVDTLAQPIELGDPDPGATTRLTSSEVTGTADGSFALDGLAFTLDSTSTGTQTLEVTDAAGVRELTQELRITTRSEPATR